MKNKTLLFSLTKKDFVMQTFTVSGNGGQRRNSKQTGVRYIHPESGAVGEGREYREQHRNKEAAFKRMTEDPKFKAWIRLEAARRTMDMKEVERRVEEAMRPENIKEELF